MLAFVQCVLQISVLRGGIEIMEAWKTWHVEADEKKQVAPLLLLGSKYDHIVTFKRLCDLGFFIGFTGPKLWSLYSIQICKKEYASEQGGISADVIKKVFNATEEKLFQFLKHQMPIRPKIASVGSCCLVGAISDGELHVAN